jgi:hypothetical protein
VQAKDLFRLLKNAAQTVEQEKELGILPVLTQCRRYLIRQ